MGVEVVVEGLTKSFGWQAIWRDVSLTLPAGEVSVLLGPSGTGKSVFLKSMIGLLQAGARHVRDQRRGHRVAVRSTSCTRSASCSVCCSRTARCSAR